MSESAKTGVTDRIADLAERLARYNAAYRRGTPVVSDGEYDRLAEALRELAPEHPFLQTVEPEAFPGKQKIQHDSPMLSIEKAYTPRALALFTARVQKAAETMGAEDIRYRVTPKLDGVAGRDDGQRLVTRGDGEFGYDITSAYDKGVIAINGRGCGLGEVVMSKSYFEARLADDFEHPRNLVVGIIASDQVNDLARRALSDGVVHFACYGHLSDWMGDAEALVAGIEDIYDDLLSDIDYPVDGVVIQVDNASVREAMGRTAHHYRWQIAYKRRGETATTTVHEVTWQVGRTGNITPVMEVAPVRLSGATIRRVTAHNAARVEADGIGPGARIEIIRSGEVIHKLEAVITPAASPSIPDTCPSCGTALQRGDEAAASEKFLRCPNRFNCRDQQVQRVRHWFNMLGNADWFGIRSVEKLVDAGFDSIEAVYAMAAVDFEALGFGPVQSRNLFEAMANSRVQPLEDWRFLAAFGIPDVGVGDGRKLLRHFPLEALPEVPAEDIAALKGFGEKKAASIAGGMNDIRKTFLHMLALGFNLTRTPLAAVAADIQSPISGKGIVFTGKMVHGTRDEMEALARAAGATVQKSVSGNTDILVCGENVGPSKLAKARQRSVELLSEAEFMALVASEDGSGGDL